MWYVSAGTTTVGPFRSDIDANDWMDANTGNENWELYYEGKSMIKVTEVQDKDTTRLYHLDGPRLDTVASFWDYLVATREIDGYEIEEVA